MCRLCRFGIGYWSRNPNAGLGQKKKCFNKIKKSEFTNSDFLCYYLDR